MQDTLRDKRQWTSGRILGKITRPTPRKRQPDKIQQNQKELFHVAISCCIFLSIHVLNILTSQFATFKNSHDSLEAPSYEEVVGQQGGRTRGPVTPPPSYEKFISLIPPPLPDRSVSVEFSVHI